MSTNADNTSLVPKFQFSTTLEQQDRELPANLLSSVVPIQQTVQHPLD